MLTRQKRVPVAHVGLAYLPDPQKGHLTHLINLTRGVLYLRIRRIPFHPFPDTFLFNLCHFCVTFVTLKSSHLNSNSIRICQILGAQSRHILCRLSDQPAHQKVAESGYHFWVPLLATLSRTQPSPTRTNSCLGVPKSLILGFWV